MDKYKLLGMNPSTASNRLVKDILFDFVIKAGHTCYRCGKALKRENFSIEHKDAWMQSDDPKAAFFNIDNIAYSHLKCNVSNTTRRGPTHGTEYMYRKGCRCSFCIIANSEYRKSIYTIEARRRRYNNEKNKNQGVAQQVE